MKRVDFLFFILLGIMFCGCFADRELKEEYFGVKRAGLTASGALEIEGSYLESSWGITELRGKVSGDTITLYGTVSHGRSNKIFRRLEKLPPHIKKVKVGSKVIWQRGKTSVVQTIPAAKTPAANTAAAVPPEKLPVTRIKIGSSAHLPEPVEFMEFTEIFWGKELPPPFDPAKEPGTKYFDGKNFPGIRAINDFPETEILEIIGTPEMRSIDLSPLDLPKLKKLQIYNVEVSGLEKAKLPALEIFRIDDFRQVPLGKVVLPENTPALHTVYIQSFAGNFDFDSLRGKPLKKLQIHGEFSSLDFLRGVKVEELKLSGFRMIPGMLDILDTLPLKKLKINTRRVNDWRFLKNLNLQLLDITVGSGSNFSPELLKNMPLEVLRLHSAYIDYTSAWEKCRDLPLKEFILWGGVVPEKFLMDAKIEKLALCNSHWHNSRPELVFARMDNLKHLAAWRMILLQNGRPGILMDDYQKWLYLPRNLESVRIPAANLYFMRRLPQVTNLALQNSGKQKVSLAPVSGRKFDKLLLNFPEQDMQRYNVVEKCPRKRDVLASEW